MIKGNVDLMDDCYFCFGYETECIGYIPRPENVKPKKVDNYTKKVYDFIQMIKKYCKSK